MTTYSLERAWLPSDDGGRVHDDVLVEVVDGRFTRVEPGAAGNASVREQLTHFSRFYPAPRDVDEVIAAVGLTEKAKARVRSLSGGQRRRLDVALGVDGEIEQAVAGDLIEHVREEGERRLDRRAALAVEIDLDADVGLARLALDAGGAGHGA